MTASTGTVLQTTLLLDQTAWDCVLDASGNWAVAGMPYSIAQDVASAVRTFLGECWYNAALGLPYWQNILGRYPPLSFVRSQIEQAALSVQNVVRATVILLAVTDRVLTGQVQVTDVNGNSSAVGF